MYTTYIYIYIYMYIYIYIHEQKEKTTNKDKEGKRTIVRTSEEFKREKKKGVHIS